MKRIMGILLACLMLFGMTGGALAEVYTGTAMGFGGEVSVSVTMDGNGITGIAIAGENETPGIGERVVAEMPERILAGQLDGISGCTVTSNAVLEALENALAAAGGQGELPALKMAAGRYEAEAMGYSRTRPVKVEVTVTEDAISQISVVSHKENEGILESVVELLIPRMVERQSLTVDAICGATASSGAVKAAVEACVREALHAAGSDEAAVKHFHKAYAPEPKEERISVDVLVVGMGAAGSAAAMMAADTQKNEGMEVSVLALDKAGKFGGTGCNTSVMLSFDSAVTEAFFNDGEHYFDKALADQELRGAVALNDFQELGWQKILNESGEMLDWLISHGFYFGPAKPGLAGSYPVTVEYTGGPGEAALGVTYGYYKRMMEDFESLGGQYLLETEATALLRDEEGKVCGVEAYNAVTGTRYTIDAKAVILATGGFGANDAMEEALYEGHQTGAYRHDISMMQNDGKMIASAIELGAATAGLEDCLNGVIWNIGIPNRLTGHEIIWEEGSYDLFRDDTGAWSFADIPEMMVNDWDGVFLNPEGRRFVNEAGVWAGKHNNGSLYYTLWSKDLLDHVDANGFSVNFSGNFLTTSSMTAGVFPLMTGVKDMGADLYGLMEECVDTGNALKADSLEELAALAGMDPAVLQETVERYNAACEAGVDEDFGKEPPFLHSLGQEGPWYLLKAMPRAYSSGGGLLVNEQLQVMSAADERIALEGLFAAGTDCLGATPPFFYGGEYLSWSFVSGRGAGEAAARFAAGRDMTADGGNGSVDYLAYVQEHGMSDGSFVEGSAPTELLRPAG